MSVCSFDGNNKIIQLYNISPIGVKDIYSDWKRWVIIGDNSKFLPAFKYVGGDPTLPGQFLGSTFFLINGWVCRPSNNDQNLVVDGNIFTDDQRPVFIPTIGVHTVAVQNAFSNLTTIIDNQLAIPTPEEIAHTIWRNSLNGDNFNTSSTIGHHLKTIIPNKLDESTNSILSATNDISNKQIEIVSYLDLLQTTTSNTNILLSDHDVRQTSADTYIISKVDNIVVPNMPTAEEIADTVWSTDITKPYFDLPSTIGNYIKNKVLTVARYLASKN